MSNAAARTGIRIQTVEGGITAPAGFKAAGVYAAIKPPTHAWPLDVMVMTADRPVPTAAVFTTNKTIAAPVTLSREHLAKSGGRAKAIVCNSGCANACTGDAGLKVAQATAEFTAGLDRLQSRQRSWSHRQASSASISTSTKSSMASPARRRALSRDQHHNALLAIMTTDPFPKETAVSVETSAGVFRIGGMAKGSGMIEPMMATMLGFLTCDAEVPPALLRKALTAVTRDTFNAITVDGECSTNDTVFAMANGASGVVIDDGLYPAARGGPA